MADYNYLRKALERFVADLGLKRRAEFTRLLTEVVRENQGARKKNCSSPWRNCSRRSECATLIEFRGDR